MCDRIAIINRGNLVALDTTQKMLERIESKIIKFKVKESKNFEKIKLDGVKFVKSNGQITASYDKNKIKFDQIIEEVKNNVEILILFILGATTFTLFEAFGPAVTAVSIFLYPVFYFLLKAKEA